MATDKDYWFPAKRYGWGWGLPRRWQGWVVLIVYFALVVAGRLYLLRRGQEWWFAVEVTLSSAVLLAICWWKGEPTGWRWGEGDRP